MYKAIFVNLFPVSKHKVIVTYINLYKKLQNTPDGHKLIRKFNDYKSKIVNDLNVM